MGNPTQDTSGPLYAGFGAGGLVDDFRHEYQRDNLATMLFVAALFHGVLILGISFNALDPLSRIDSTEAMEVVILTRDYEKRPDVSDAEYLAQQNLAGSGNTTEDAALRVGYGQDGRPLPPGPPQEGDASGNAPPSAERSAEHLLYARRPDAGAVPAERREFSDEKIAATGLPGESNSVEILAPPDTETVIKGAKPRQLIVTANTRESRLASYLDGWKRRVERVGTLNFPRAALSRGSPRDPVLEVSIAANGSLAGTRLLTASGNPELDRAAINILRLAAPFDPFPEVLLNDYDVLKFSYEWRFSNRSVGRMTVPQARN